MGPAIPTIAAGVVGFFDASWAFNLTSFGLGVVGLLITTGGFWLTIQQVRQAKREAKRAGDAADAAKQAATDAKQQVSAIAAVVDAATLVDSAREVMTHIGHADYAAAELRAHDLRAGLAKFRRSPAGRQAVGDEPLQDMVTAVALVHGEMVGIRYGAAVDLGPVKRCHKIIADVHERLSGIVPEAAQRAVG